MRGDTIFALASAPGRAGIAVLRVSGPDAARAFGLCAPAGKPKPRTAMLREIRDAENGQPIDRALVLWFPAPRSFTGEDVAEFHLHGGRAIVNAVMRNLRGLKKFRHAEAGEFSRRAFENGRMDLTEAEAIADLVDAETEAQRRQAMRQFGGELARLYEGWRARLTNILARLEAAIDFSDEDLPKDMEEKQTAEIRFLGGEIVRHLEDRRGERLRDGFEIAILGPPNAGKSSLLNALARREAAIVSSVAGTTRDVVEAHLDLGGYPVILADTAGLRESADAVESEGVRRALARAEKADLRLLVFDGGKFPELDGTTRALMDENAIVVLNKADLIRKSEIGSRKPEKEQSLVPSLQIPKSIPINQNNDRWRGNVPLPLREGSGEGFSPQKPASGFVVRTPHPGSSPGQAPASPQGGRDKANPIEGYALIPISAKTGEGIPELLERIVAAIEKHFAGNGAPPFTRERHRAALEDCAAHLARAQKTAGELRAEDIKLAARALGRITGRVDVEDMLDAIFRDFCIGK